MFDKSCVFVAFLLVVHCLFCPVTANDEFHEELFIKPLPTGHLNTFFQFTTNSPIKNNESLHHTNLLARPLAELLLKYDLKELHVSLTHGLWRYENWGYPVVDASPGAEVWAWFNAGDLKPEAIDEQWKELCGVLSGLLCASLSFIDNTNTVEPKFSFRPQFSPGVGSLNRDRPEAKHQIRYATLPREIVCTENLTPWKKLMPCHQHEGFASLLNSGYIHSTNYHSLGLHLRTLCRGNVKTCDGSTAKAIELRQTVNLVFDKQIIASSATTNADWSLRKMFGQGLNGVCVLSSSSRIYVDVTDADFQLTPEPTETILSQRGGTPTTLVMYDIKNQFQHHMFNVAAVYKSEKNSDGPRPVQIVSPPPLFAKRFLLGVGQERGKILTKITNTHWTSVNVVLQENVPWFVPIYLHTLTIRVTATGEIITPNAINYLPGRLRERPSHLEVAFKCPKRSTIEVSIDFDYVFLKWLEYPPDANHGHYIGSAILTAQLPIARNFTGIPIDGQLLSDGFNASRSGGYLIHIRTESLLISLPTPDFSMPYNVICLACTVVALAFGPIHNISTKKLAYSKIGEPAADGERVSLFGKIKNMIFGRK